MIKKMPFHQLPRLYFLMKEVSFPNVEQGLWRCLWDLLYVDVYAVYKEGRLIAAFIYGQDGMNGAFLDLVAAQNQQKIWLNKTVLKSILEQAQKYSVLWVEPKNSHALRLCLKAGFKMVEGCFTNPLLVTTPKQLQTRFNKNNKL